MLFRLLLNNLHNGLSISKIDMEHLIDNSRLPIVLYMPGCHFYKYRKGKVIYKKGRREQL